MRIVLLVCLSVLGCRHRQNQVSSTASGLAAQCGGLGDCTTLVKNTFAWKAKGTKMERYLLVEPGGEGLRSFRWTEVVMPPGGSDAQVVRGEGSVASPDVAIFVTKKHSCGEVAPHSGDTRRIHRQGPQDLALKSVTPGASLGHWRMPRGENLAAEQFLSYERVAELPRWTKERCL